MHISYKPLWHTLLERDMRKEDLRSEEQRLNSSHNVASRMPSSA